SSSPATRSRGVTPSSAPTAPSPRSATSAAATASRSTARGAPTRSSRRETSCAAASGSASWSRSPVSGAALPAELAEAELFGYRKGAFTGAGTASAGLFRAAHGGTIFLDEILDLPVALQPKLLRVLEERHVRVVAATQEPLPAAVAERRFRADLHARLDGLTIVLPPLRARREDVVPLFT